MLSTHYLLFAQNITTKHDIVSYIKKNPCPRYRGLIWNSRFTCDSVCCSWILNICFHRWMTVFSVTNKLCLSIYFLQLDLSVTFIHSIIIFEFQCGVNVATKRRMFFTSYLKNGVSAVLYSRKPLSESHRKKKHLVSTCRTVNWKLYNTSP